MKFRRFITLIIVVFTIAANAMISMNGLFGHKIGEVSDKYSTVATPADYTFSIWAVIYTGLFAFAIWQWLKWEKFGERLHIISYWLWINLLANISWLIFFHAEALILSLVAMLIILASLVIIVYQLYKQTQFPQWVIFVFETYLAWISVAALVNFSLVANYRFHLSLNHQEAVWWLFVPLFLLAIISMVINNIRKQLSFFSFALIWAFIGIHMQHKAIGLQYTFIPLLPLLIIVPDVIVHLLVRSLHRFKSIS